MSSVLTHYTRVRRQALESRRKGVATSLLKHAIDSLDSQRVRTVRLDATAAGRPVSLPLED